MNEDISYVQVCQATTQLRWKKSQWRNPHYLTAGVQVKECDSVIYLKFCTSVVCKFKHIFFLFAHHMSTFISESCNNATLDFYKCITLIPVLCVL